MSSTTLATIIDGMIALAIVVAVTVLLALHDLSETTAIALYGVAVTLVGGSAKSLLALKIPAPTQHVSPPVTATPTPPAV